MMSLRFVLAAATLSSPAWAWLVDPPTTGPADTVEDCSWWAVAESTDTCRSLADGNFVSLVELQRWNPSLAKTPCAITSGLSYCVEKNYGQDDPISTSKTTSTTGPITTSNGVTTPSPIQTTMVGNCNKFFLNKAGEGYCADIATKNGISLANFYAWNPAVGSDCGGLWLDTYYCVGVIGQTPAPITTTTSTSSTSKPGNGITTPAPTQTGMAPNCNTFHKVVEWDNCVSIAEKKGITLNSFYKWNTGVGSNCEKLWLDTWYCVNIIGGTTLKPTSTAKPTTTSTTKGNGVATPTPVQTGMVKNCNKFTKVSKGQNCETIVSAAKITLANFYKWNPDVGSMCGFLWLDYYVCVGTL